MPIPHTSDHVDSGLSKLLTQYRRKPRLASWIKSYLLEVQALTDAIRASIVMRLLDAAEGVWLDYLGTLVGQKREGHEDPRFRVLIRARILVNRSNGFTDELLYIAEVLFGSAPAIDIIDYYPGMMVLTVWGVTVVPPDIEHRMLEEAAAGGVRLDVHYSEAPLEELFNFGTGPGWGVGVWVGTYSEHTV